jgi:hypothetical protein
MLGDDAAWIWQLADDYWTQRLEVVDFYHASEPRATVAQARFADASTPRTSSRTGNARLHKLARGTAPGARGPTLWE